MASRHSQRKRHRLARMIGGVVALSIGTLSLGTPLSIHAETDYIRQAPYEVYRTLPGAKITFASPVLADLDGDKYQEIILGTSDGRINVVKPNDADGTLLWSFDVTSAMNAVAYRTSGATVRGGVTVADLDADGTMEIIVPVGEVHGANQNGGIVVLSHTGQLESGWPQLTYPFGALDYSAGIAKPPAVADLDGDGDLEIIAGAFDMRVYAWHHDGTLVDGWPRFVYDTVWSSPSVGDLDNDGRMEVVVGVDAHRDPYRGSIDGGALYVFEGDGTISAGFPLYINEILWSSPALADIDGDGYLDIVIGGGDFYHTSDGYRVHVWNRFGELLSGWPQSTGGSITGSPAISDLDGDGDVEIIVGSADRKIYAWHHNGSRVNGWPMEPHWWNGGTAGQTSVVVANLDGDGKLEIFANSGWEVVVVSSTGQQLTWDGTAGNPEASPTYFTNYTLDAMPAVGDVDGDGKFELVAGGAGPGGTSAAVYVWELSNSQASLDQGDWPMFKQEPARSGLYPVAKANDAIVADRTASSHLLPGESVDVEIVLRNTGTQTWTPQEGYYLSATGGTAFSTPARVNLTQPVLPGQEARFNLSLEAPLNEGHYDLSWRMAKDGVGGFGAAVPRNIKVGNTPGFYALYSRDLGDEGGIVRSGTSLSIAEPDYNYWSAAQSLSLTPDGRGYFLLDGPGGYVVWAGTADDVGSIGTDPAVDLALSPDGGSYHMIDAYGRISSPAASPVVSPSAPTFSDQRVRSFDVIQAQGKVGVYVLDKYGNVYTGGKVAPISPSTPVFGTDIAMKIRLAPDARGYYVLDRYGRLYNGGDAPVLTPNYTPHIGEDWARDFELTADGLGYYVIDRDGNIYSGGNAVEAPARTASSEGSGRAVDLEIYDARIRMQPFLVLSVGDSVSIMTDGDEPDPLISMHVANGGAGGSIAWQAEIVSGGSWLGLVGPTSGVTPSAVQVRVDTPTVLGTYTGIIRFHGTADGYPDSVWDVEVNLLVVEEIHRAFAPMILR